MYELDLVQAEIERLKPDGCRLLEIGAGTGWQAKELSERGYEVEAIDLEVSNYSRNRVWPILDYDGEHVPFPDNHFDVVFSSNVLEHIPHIVAFQDELLRVLTPDGIAVHIVPGGNWAFWTVVSHYPFIVKSVVRALIGKLLPAFGNKDTENDLYNAGKLRKGTKSELIKKIILPSRHGERGNWFTEIYYFSWYKWASLFTNAGWVINSHSTNRLFYTGNLIIGSAASLSVRKRLAYIFGGVCHIFVLVKER